MPYPNSVNIISGPTLFLFLGKWYVFTIIHGCGRAMKNGKGIRTYVTRGRLKSDVKGQYPATNKFAKSEFCI